MVRAVDQATEAVLIVKAMELGRREDREWRDGNRRQAIVAGVSLI